MLDALKKYLDGLFNFNANEGDDSLIDRRLKSGHIEKQLVIHPSHSLIDEFVSTGDFQGLSAWGMQYITAIKEKVQELRQFGFSEYDTLIDSMEDECDVDLHEIEYFSDLTKEEIYDWFELISDYLQETIDFRTHLLCLERYRSRINEKYDEIQTGLEELNELRLKLCTSKSYQSYLKNETDEYTSLEDYIATVSTDINPLVMAEISYAEMNEEKFQKIILLFNDVINQTSELITEAKRFMTIDYVNLNGGQLPYEANTLDELEKSIRDERERLQKEKEERIANTSKAVSIVKGNGSAGTGEFAKRFGSKNAEQESAKSPETNNDTNSEDE